MSVHLTELEDQVLQTFAVMHGPAGSMNVALVRICGAQIFGEAWYVYAENHKLAQTVIGCTFGRLRQKGLITREHSTYAQVEGRDWGWWSLTPCGRKALGLPPAVMTLL